MGSSHCEREAETVRAAWERLAGGPADADLDAHVASCSICAQIATIAPALRDERDAERAVAQPPAAAVVWWRAQRRAREEAARRAARPIALIHAIAIGTCAAAVVATLSMSGRSASGWLFSWASGLPSALVQFAATDLAWPLGPVLLLSTSLILLPVAIYLAFASD